MGGQCDDGGGGSMMVFFLSACSSTLVPAKCGTRCPSTFFASSLVMHGGEICGEGGRKKEVVFKCLITN